MMRLENGDSLIIPEACKKILTKKAWLIKYLLKLNKRSLFTFKISQTYVLLEYAQLSWKLLEKKNVYIIWNYMNQPTALKNPQILVTNVIKLSLYMKVKHDSKSHLSSFLADPLIPFLFFCKSSNIWMLNHSSWLSCHLLTINQQSQKKY